MEVTAGRTRRLGTAQVELQCRWKLSAFSFSSFTSFSCQFTFLQGWYSEVENMEKDCVPSDSKSCSVDKFG